MGRPFSGAVLQCLQCGVSFKVRAYRAKVAKFCSLKCRNISLQKRPTFVCHECGISKTPHDFYRDKCKPRGYVARCKTCYSKRQKQDQNRLPRRYSFYKLNAQKRRERVGFVTGGLRRIMEAPVPLVRWDYRHNRTGSR